MSTKLKIALLNRAAENAFQNSEPHLANALKTAAESWDYLEGYLDDLQDILKERKMKAPKEMQELASLVDEALDLDDPSAELQKEVKRLIDPFAEFFETVDQTIDDPRLQKQVLRDIQDVSKRAVKSVKKHMD